MRWPFALALLLSLCHLSLSAPDPAFAQKLCKTHTDCSQKGLEPCQMRLCVEGQCKGQPSPISGQFCDDGDPCTFADRCNRGTCEAGFRKRTPECVPVEETLPLCEVSTPTEGTVLVCPVRIDPSSPQIITALQFTASVPEGLHLHGFYARELVEGRGEQPIALKTTHTSSSTLLQSGHGIITAPSNPASFPDAHSLGAIVVHLSDPATPLPPELFELHFVATRAGSWVVPAAAVIGSARGEGGSFVSVKGSAGINGSLRFAQ